MTHPNPAGGNWPDHPTMTDADFDALQAQFAAFSITQSGGGQAVEGWNAFDATIFYLYSTQVYPVTQVPTTAGQAPALHMIDARTAQYEFLVAAALAIRDTLNAMALPGQFPVPLSLKKAVQPGEDVFGMSPAAIDTWVADATNGGNPPPEAAAFIAWYSGVVDNPNWQPVLAQAARNFATVSNTERDYYEVGAPGFRSHRIFDVEQVDALMSKYGLDVMDVVGDAGMGLLTAASSTDLPLESVFDIATTAQRRHTAVVTGDRQADLALEQMAVAGAISRYNEKALQGFSHVQAKVYAFGGEDLLDRVMGIDAGTMEAQLTDDELSEILGILGPDWHTKLGEMLPFAGQDHVGSFRFADYIEKTATRGPVEIPGDTMREAARVLAEGWRMNPMSDQELDAMVNSFGAKMRQSMMLPPVWGQQPGPGQGMSYTPLGGVYASEIPIQETPDMRIEAMSAVRGSDEYQSLYGQKPPGMSEEEWIGRFSGATTSLGGLESRAGTRVGMETGNMTLARQTALTDPSAKGGAWYRRLAAWRKAFQ